VNQKNRINEYKSFAEWKEKNFPKLQRESDLNELKKDSGHLGVILANESIEKVLKSK
jgi:hypothetical protein